MQKKTARDEANKKNICVGCQGDLWPSPTGRTLSAADTTKYRVDSKFSSSDATSSIFV